MMKLGLLLSIIVILVIPSRGLQINQIIPNVISQLNSGSRNYKGCPVEARRDAIEWCYLPDGLKTTQVNDYITSVPHSTKCAFQTGRWLSTVSCKGCYHGRWRKTDCTKGLYAPRVKKGLGLALIVGGIILCAIFCGGGVGGGGGVYIPPVIICHGPPSRTFAEMGLTSARITWSTPTGKDGKGKALIPQLISGIGDSGTSFPRGYHTISYSITDSMGFKDYCFFTFEVAIHTCGPVPWPRDGRRVCDGTEMLWGKSCTVNCDTGYELQGSSVVTCQQGGNYDAASPTCEAKLCSPLTSPVNGNQYQCTDEWKYGSLCFSSCKDGFRRSGSPFTTCLSSGSWLLPLPECEDNLAPVFDNCPLNSIIVFADPGLTSTTVDYDLLTATDNTGPVTPALVQGLPPGSTFERGAHTIQYVAEDNGGNRAYCFFSISVRVLNCGVPDYSDDNMDITCPDGFQLGSECSIGCRAGIQLIGPNTITCERDDSDPPQTSWDFNIIEQPFCRALPCPELALPINGALSCDSSNSGSHCSMLCNSKFDIPRSAPANALYICGWQSGLWAPTNDIPDCTETRLPNRMVLPSELYYYDGDCSSVATQNQIKTNFRNILENSLVKDQLCPNGCTVVGVDIKCGPVSKKKRSADIWSEGLMNYVHNLVKRETQPLIILFTIEIPFNLNGATPADARTAHEATLDTIIARVKDDSSNGLYDDVVPGFNVRSDSVQSDWSDFGCPEGQLPVYSSVSCRGCPTGMMYNSVNGNCSYCPVGSYQDEAFSLTCKSCPDGTSTIKEGARNESRCLTICAVGESSPTGLVPCSLCSVGRYQDVEGSKVCAKCPDETSSGAGSLTLSDCQAYDLIAKRSAQLTSKHLKADVEDFSIISWFRHPRKPTSASSIQFVHNKILLLKIWLSENLSISILGSVEVSGVSIGNEWNHLVVTWQQSTKQLKIFVGGELQTTTTVSSVSSTLLLENSTLEITTGQDSELKLRSLRLRSGILQDTDITNMATSCDTTSSQTMLSLQDVKTENKNKISIEVPSSCDAVDECLTAPCGGHICINEPAGFKCHCFNGYTGTTCTRPPDFCLSNGCQNGAACSSLHETKSFTCTCREGFKGRLCDKQIVNGNFGNWTDWGECSVTCGGGSQQRIRTCDNPSPGEDGKPCVGSDTDVRSCNENKCPECKSSDLQRAFGASYTCTGTTSSLSCEITCREETFYTEDEPTTFNCSGGFWLPGTKLLPCKRIQAPNSLSVRGAVNYEIDCSDEVAVETLKSQFSNKIEEETCAGKLNCDYKVEVADCSGDRQRREAGTTLTVILSVDITTGDLNLEAFDSNETISPQLLELIQTIQILEEAGQILNNDTDLFDVTINGITYKISTMAVTGETYCNPGSVGNSGLCIECPPGTYSTGLQCVYCSQGYYQHVAGQETCIECPVGWTTEFIGSIEDSLCSVSTTPVNPSVSTTTIQQPPIEASNQPPTDQDDVDEPPADSQDDSTTIIAVTSVIGCVVLVTILIFLVILIYSRSRKPRRSQVVGDFEKDGLAHDNPEYLTAVHIKTKNY